MLFNQFLVTLMLIVSLARTVTNQNVCLNTIKAINTENYCPKVVNETRILITDNDNNYLNYSGGSLKILKSSDFVIFYDCPNHMTYTRTFLKNFSLVEPKKRRPSSNFGEIRLFKEDIEFQSCLKDYCNRSRNAVLQCNSNDITYLNLKLDAKVNTRCLETITLAYINSFNLIDINSSKFFIYAYNLIKFVIKALKNVKTINCDVFQSVSNLKILQIVDLNIEKTLCIFQKNPSLALIANGTHFVWDMCNGSYDSITSLHYNPITMNMNTRIRINSTANQSTVTSTNSIILYILLGVGILLIILLTFFQFLNLYQLCRGYVVTRPTEQSLELRSIA